MEIISFIDIIVNTIFPIFFYGFSQTFLLKLDIL